MKHASDFLRRPVTMIFITGMAIRLILSPFFTMGYDVYHWALVIENIQSGNGLYGLAGYYYTPVWGYILGFTSLVQELLMNIPVFGERFTEALPIEFGGYTGATATVTTVAFNISFKLILFVADVLVGFLIYSTIKSISKDERKATLGFAMWFLCPAVMVISSVTGMFDSYSALFLLLTVIFMYRSNYVLAGAMFSLSVLTKFFPLFFLMFFVAYILKKHHDDGAALRNMAKVIAGAAAMALILYIPIIMTGTVADSLSFMTARAGETGGSWALVIYSVLLLAVTAVAWIYYKKGDLGWESVMRYLLLTALITLLNPPTPQYTLIMMPFLILCTIITDRRLMFAWVLLSIFVTFNALTSNFTLLLSVGAYTDMVSLDAVIDLIEWYRGVTVFGASLEYIIYFTANKLQQFCIWFILLFMLRKEIMGFFRRIRGRSIARDHAVNE